MTMIMTINAAEEKHLERVIERMKEVGEPTIRAWWDGEKFLAIEGSHRLHAAERLGYLVEIEDVDLEDTIDNHDLDDLPKSTTVEVIINYMSDSKSFVNVEIS